MRHSGCQDDQNHPDILYHTEVMYTTFHDTVSDGIIVHLGYGGAIWIIKMH